MGVFTQLLSFNGLARRLPTICEKSSQWMSKSDSRQTKDVLKTICFSNYFMLAVYISLIKFSKIVFAVWNFVRSLKFYYKNNFCPSLHAFKINNWIDFSTLNWIAHSEEIRYVYSREILLNTATMREVNLPLQHQTTSNQTNFHNFKTRSWIYLQWLSLAF